MKRYFVLLLALLLLPLTTHAAGSAIKFMEPGGDATFNVATVTNGGFWQLTPTGNVTTATDFVHSTHIKSIKPAFDGTFSYVVTPDGVVADTNGRISFYVYVNSLSGTSSIMSLEQAGDGSEVAGMGIDSTGHVIVTDTFNTQQGPSGSVVSTGAWHRLSFVYSITSTTVNSFKIFIDGTLGLTVTNITLAVVTSSCVYFGNVPIIGLGADIRFSDIYIDNSNAGTDPGDIWVTAKRPVSNGTTNGFTTQIGSGGSGYGTGHSPQVNERPLSITNGWSVVGAGSTATEEYNVEAKAVGDFNLTTATIAGSECWVYAKALASETASGICSSPASISAPLTSTATMLTGYSTPGSTGYPAGTGADVGLTTTAAVTTVSLYEAGSIIAFIPGAATTTPRALINWILQWWRAF